jgi:hydroxyethylthiazole kinase-like uncharacterized protein yjeF
MFPKIVFSNDMRQWDDFTIEKQKLSAIDLMERAAIAFSEWFIANNAKTNSVTVLCGKGNNGGDGFAIARLLYEANFQVTVFFISEAFSTTDARLNFERLKQTNITPLTFPEDLVELKTGDIIIDALLGTGLNKPLRGSLLSIVNHINNLKQTIIAVDVPSGLQTDFPQIGEAIQATTTITFERPKKAFFFPENYQYVGEWRVVTIGLDLAFEKEINTTDYFITLDSIRPLIKIRPKFSHKGTYGHTLIVGGSKGKFGALVLATKAALKSGAGLVSAASSTKIGAWFHVATPEAMTIELNNIPKNITAIAIGPGLGTSNESLISLKTILNLNLPTVLDADAINLLALNKELVEALPPKTILTPHPKEFKRLFGKFENWQTQTDFIKTWCKKHQHIIILKGAHTCIGLPNSELYFNTSGCNGMATAGSGDVLTGFISGLLAQHYTPKNAAIVGVYLHGLAGELAATEVGNEALTASDIINQLGKAFLKIKA